MDMRLDSIYAYELGLLLHVNGVLKTKDGGTTFTEIVPESRPEYWDPTSLHVVSENHYLLTGLKPFISVSSVQMYETLDGGLTWEEAILSNEYIIDAFCSSNNCFAVGYGSVYRKFDENTTSIQDFKHKRIEIFPNPTADLLQLGIAENLIDRLEILDVNGRRYQQYNIDDKVLDVSRLPAGIFFLRIEYQGLAESCKFVKK
jgi:hypothetical protein